MKRIVQRILVITGASAALLAAAQTAANAGLALNNHSEPTAVDR